MKQVAGIILLIFLVSTALVDAQDYSKKEKSKYSYILTTTNIKDIEQFLETAHPQDPRRQLSKRRLITLKNKTWMKNGPIIPMEARPIEEYDPNFQTKFVDEVEFEALVKENTENHTAKTVNVLNTLFNPDLQSTDRIVLIQNNSSCNIIVELKEKNIKKLAIQKHSEDFIILTKGTYLLDANVCGTAYSSVKNIQKNQILVLSEPVFIKSDKIVR